MASTSSSPALNVNVCPALGQPIDEALIFIALIQCRVVKQTKMAILVNRKLRVFERDMPVIRKG